MNTNDPTMALACKTKSMRVETSVMFNVGDNQGNSMSATFSQSYFKKMRGLKKDCSEKELYAEMRAYSIGLQESFGEVK